MQTIEEIWERIEAWLGRYTPQVLPSFQPGATEEELKQAEAALGVALPEDLKALYRLHNGSNYASFLDRWALLSVEQGVQTWQMGQDFFHFANREISATGPVLRISWHPQWIPFMSDGAGDYLCLDLAPGPGGDVGQVIYQGKETDGWGPFAPSLYWYLAFFATELEDGDYYIDVFGKPDSEARLSTVGVAWLPLPEKTGAVSQNDLIARVASRTGASIEDAAGVVEALFATIREALALGGEVRLVGFGSFGYVRMPEHTAINPPGGATFLVPARRQVHFASGDDLQRALMQPADG